MFAGLLRFIATEVPEDEPEFLVKEHPAPVLLPYGLDLGEKHDRELQALRRMDGHHTHSVRTGDVCLTDLHILFVVQVDVMDEVVEAGERLRGLEVAGHAVELAKIAQTA